MDAAAAPKCKLCKKPLTKEELTGQPNCNACELKLAQQETEKRHKEEAELIAKGRAHINHPSAEDLDRVADDQQQRAATALTSGDYASLAVFRDQNGTTYLLVSQARKSAQYVVLKGFSVEEVTIPRLSELSMGLQQETRASIQSVAKRLLRPLNNSVIISKRAFERLTSIVNNKELQMAETTEAKTAKKSTKAAVIPASKNKGAKGIGYVPDYTVVLKKQPKEDTKLPKQALAILAVLQKKGGTLEYPKLIAALEGQIETQQPVAKIWSFYRNRLEEEGFVQVKEKAAKF
jgi:uncharacterized Zn finger protein (UPF0148 family)